MSPNGQQTQTLSPYERIGGAEAVQSVVDLLYWMIMRDKQVKGYFNAAYLPNVMSHMVKLLSQLLGGPRQYAGRHLNAAHRHLNITPEHYDRVARYVVASLLIHHVPDDIIDTVKGVIADTKKDIVSMPQTGEG